VGLTVFYDLRARMPATQSRAVVSQLQAAARELPFDQISDLREFTAPSGSRRSRKPLLVLSATRAVEYRSPKGELRALFVSPEHCTFFTVLVTGAESASLGLATYRAQVELEDGSSVPTGLDGLYSWHSWCKTQYAALPACGGTPNFLRAHVSLIRLLDRARELDLELDVRDDGGYFESRSEERLLAELDSSNRAVAALAGHIKDALSRFFQVDVIEAPIIRHPNFEHLEAEGRRQREPP
jgi:hypothetical protein